MEPLSSLPNMVPTAQPVALPKTPPSPPREPLVLTPPPLHLHDRLHTLSLTFTASLHILLPPAADHADWRDYILLRGSGFALNLTLEYNGTDISGSSGAPEIWARTVANAEMWKQLGFTPALSIFTSPAKIQILLRRSSASELALPAILPESTAELSTIAMTFSFHGVDDSASPPPPPPHLIPLTDTALRSFWSDKVAKYAPLLGKPGVLDGLDKRREYADTLVDILRRRKPDAEPSNLVEEEINVRERLWRIMIANIKKSGALKTLQSDEEVGLDEEIQTQEIEAPVEPDTWEEDEALFGDAEDDEFEALRFSSDDDGEVDDDAWFSDDEEEQEILHGLNDNVLAGDDGDDLLSFQEDEHEEGAPTVGQQHEDEAILLASTDEWLFD